MAVWTDIANTQVEADAPVTTDLMQALRDNVPAQAEGAAGAPKNQLASMDTDSVGTDQIIDANVTTPKIADANVTRNKLNLTEVVLTGTIASGDYVDLAVSEYSLMWKFNYTTTAGQTATMTWVDNNYLRVQAGIVGTNVNYTITYRRIDN